MDVVKLVGDVVVQVWRGETLETYAAKYGGSVDGLIETAEKTYEGDTYANGSFSTGSPTSSVLCDQVSALCAQKLAAGYADAVTGKTFQCDAVSIGKWTAIGASAGFAVMMAIDPVPDYQIIAADNTIVTLSAPDAYALMNARIMPWVSATIVFAREMKNDILADDPPADITAGWPQP